MKCLRISAIPWLAVCLAAGLGLPAGCGDTDPEPSQSDGQESKPLQLSDLPPLADPIGPLDQDRLTVAAPKDWHIPSRDSRWLAHFQLSDRAVYPHIFLTVEDYPAIDNVGKDNVDVFAEKKAAALANDPEVSTLLDPVTPIAIGHFNGISYRQRGKAKGKVIERVFLETVVDGRKYTVELRTLEGDLRRYRPHLQAVAVGLKFLRPEPSTDTETPDTETPDTETPDTETSP